MQPAGFFGVAMTRHFFHIQCCYNDGIDLNNRIITEEVERRLLSLLNTTPPAGSSDFPLFVTDEILNRALISVEVMEPANNRSEKHIIYHYQFRKIEENQHQVSNTDEEHGNYFRQTDLPNRQLDPLWKNLHFDSDVKDRLLQYASTVLQTSSSGLNLSVFDLHKIVLLYGEPGCGKTTLCKALAQQLSIRSTKLKGKQTDVKIVEVNCHSLFSKWFSESGKQIMVMFQEIRNLAEKENAFICLLIDEIESITISRTSLFKGSEPSDSIRAVNVLLTQIDQIKELDNILILATSNMLETVDAAFLDRVDLKFKLGRPSQRAMYEILMSGTQELMRNGLLEDSPLVGYLTVTLQQIDDSESLPAFLLNLIDGYFGERSGRSPRKLPFLALSSCLQVTTVPIPIELYCSKLRAVAQEQSSDTSMN